VPPDPAALGPLGWGVPWADTESAYSLRMTAGRGVASDRPYLLLDLANTSLPAGQVELLLGRYWFPHGGQPAVWQVLPIDTSARDPQGQGRSRIYDVAISEDGAFAAVASSRAFFVVRLSGQDDFDWEVTDTVYVGEACESTPSPECVHLDPLWIPRDYEQVDGLSFVASSHLLVSLSAGVDSVALPLVQMPKGAIVLFELDNVLGTVGNVLAVHGEEAQLASPPFPQGIPGTDFFSGGPVRTYGIDHGTYRVYAGSSHSGAVVEFEVELGEPATLTHLSTWADSTHRTQVSDVRPYSVGHPDNLPVVVVSRFLQTVAVLAATGFEDGLDE
jgi:hypothetical protein